MSENEWDLTLPSLFLGLNIKLYIIAGALILILNAINTN
jgi:hypothetical protein